ncbi:uncharacterized protein PFL1_05591 [Pseudozyma flocculosa PF-1]|uniref:Uncharacterized protein n=1 Tax=Pseudozyma flocculosa PF-1 TaxID=1277687 RepID=A0A061H8Q2_9BASI|nr:uncharacterized protein PFL1_05591 [Pseudozyma flocculosa PF-1]EPQ26956.1 hypothetical protein PFL1_05591 [Pseudozyma flocculosa PF-1]
MAQSGAQPGKRRVMGRMDIGSSDSPSSTLTPSATRPRMLRTAPGSAASSSFSTPTATSARTPTMSGRAKVDMSAYASSPSIASTPTAAGNSAMSPPLTRNASYTSARAHGITSPSIGGASASGPVARPSTSAGVAVRASSIISSPESRGEDQSFVSLRSHKARGHNRSIDLGSHASLPPSPSLSGRPDATLSNGPTSFRAPLPRAQTVINVRASAAPTPPRSRTPSPSNLEPGRFPDRSGQSLAPAYESPQELHEASGPTTASSSLSTSPRFLEAPLREGGAPLLRRRSSLASATSSTAQRSSPAVGDAKGAATSSTVGRSHARSNSAFQRPSIPKPIATSQPAFASSSGPASPRTSAPPPLLNRASFASSVGSSHDANSGLRSPTSEVSSISAAVLAEAEGARNNRKLLDLEITNKSLMAINAALEATKLKQAREIRELKRRLREGRGATMGPDEIAAQLASSLSDDDDEGDYFEDADDDGEEDAELEAAHQRCKTLIDSMVSRARQAILSKYVHEDAGLGGKVLHPLELEQMRREAEGERADEQDEEADLEGEGEGVGDVTDQTYGDVSAMSSRATTPQHPTHAGEDGDGGGVEADTRPNTSGEADDADDADESRDGSDASRDESLSQTTPEIEVDSSFVSEDDEGAGASPGKGLHGMTRTFPLESSPSRPAAVEQGHGDVSID